MNNIQFFNAIETQDSTKAIECFQFYIDNFPITVQKVKTGIQEIDTNPENYTSFRITDFNRTGSAEACIYTMKQLYKIKDKLKQYYKENHG
jgi:hypothetical protein